MKGLELAAAIGLPLLLYLVAPIVALRTLRRRLLGAPPGMLPLIPVGLYASLIGVLVGFGVMVTRNWQALLLPLPVVAAYVFACGVYWRGRSRTGLADTADSENASVS